MTKQSLEMNEVIDRLIALVLWFKGVLQNLCNFKLIKIWTLNSFFTIFVSNDFFKSIFFWRWSVRWNRCYLFLFFLLIFLEAPKLLLFLPRLKDLFLYFLNKVFHIFSWAFFVKPVVILSSWLVGLCILINISEHLLWMKTFCSKQGIAYLFNGLSRSLSFTG